MNVRPYEVNPFAIDTVRIVPVGAYGGGGGLSDEAKQAILNAFQHVAWIDEHGQDYYDDIYDAFYPPVHATSISLNTASISFTAANQSQTLVATVLPADATDAIVWESSNEGVATVNNGVVTSVSYGTCDITATAGEVSATCSVVVAQATLVSINVTYTQSGTVYDTDSLDSLKSDLLVVAVWSDSSTSTVPSTDYTLSGTLTVGTSTITVSYAGKNGTFTVTVTSDSGLYPLENGSHTFSENDRVLTVTKGYHIKYEAPNATSVTNTPGAYLNLSEVSDNDTSATTASNINKTDTLFTIPNGAEVVFEIKNISFTNVGVEGTNNKYAFALRSGSTSKVSTGDKGITETDDITITTTMTADTNITCVFAYVRNPFSMFEADIKLTVNGVRWI